MQNWIFWIVVVLMLGDFALERILSILNMRHSTQPIPDILSGIYDEEKYTRQQSYFRTNVRLGMVSSVCSFLLTFGLFVFKGFAWIDGLARMCTSNELLVSLLFFLFFGILSALVGLPFQIYDTFVVEERFGFNKVTPKLFILDRLKGWILSILISGLLLTAVIFIYQLLPDYFWLVAWAVVSAFSLFMSLFYSELIVPLFNKQTPLPEGELRSAIEAFANKTGFSLKNIYVIDNSKRSTKANAYFTGWGKKKRIVLYDTLIDLMSTDEIVAVLAHEIGHNKYKHTIKHIVVSLLTNLLMFYLLGLVLKYDVFAQAAGCEKASFHVNMLVFGVLYTPLSLLMGLAGNVLSRSNEFQADAFVKENGMADALVSALKKLSAQSLSNLTPHPTYVFFNYSHPTLYERVKALLN
ncbi:MAG: M48 family metallopeptidase [Bacteroidetes bacterium]|uniref:M48 family metallopeptidase n=1 Tax=Candidatus Gallipaludibacter merdavium TaxID=2840839 RepID=A0A9D9HW16_9BACT|nr:M48 family metallopeptidase [Candidatus Gallipaludibacter merdavium]